MRCESYGNTQYVVCVVVVHIAYLRDVWSGVVISSPMTDVLSGLPQNAMYVYFYPRRVACSYITYLTIGL